MSPVPAWRRLPALGLALLALATVLWLLALFLQSPDRGWLGHPVGAAWGVLWLLAAGGTVVVSLEPFRRRRPRLALWWPYAAAGWLLGFVVPGLFSIFPFMLLAGLACLLAALLLAPRSRGLALTLLVATLTTLAILALGRLL